MKDKYIEINNVKYPYGGHLKVGQFQKLSGIIGKLSEHFEDENITPGQFSGALAKQGVLIDVLTVLLNTDVTVVDDLEYEKVMEIVNDFFFTNGLWLMVSGFIPMPLEVSEMLTNQQKSLNLSMKNSKELETSESKKKKKIK